MRRHLAESRVSHLEGAVIEELDRVRQELGWPIVMTPFAQMVITQAVMNVTGAERYSVIPDEVIRYALGRFGKPNVPIEPAVMERIESLPRTRELRAEAAHAAARGAAPSASARGSRRGIPAARHDAGGLVDAMQAAGPAARHYDPSTKPVMDLIVPAAGAPRPAERDRLEKPGFRLALRRADCVQGDTA